MLKKIEDLVWGIISFLAYIALAIIVLWVTYKVGLLTMFVGIFLFLLEGAFTSVGGHQLPGVVLFGVYSPFVVLLSVSLALILIPFFAWIRKGVRSEKAGSK